MASAGVFSMAFRLLVDRLLLDVRAVAIIDSDVCSNMRVEIRSKLMLSKESIEFVINFMLAAKLMPPKSSSMYKSSIDCILCVKKERKQNLCKY